MTLTKLTADVENISKLPDLPNQNGGLTPAQLKAKYDQAGKDIKDFINNILISELPSEFATKEELDGIVLGQIPNDSLTEEKMASSMKKDIVGGVASYSSLKDIANYQTPTIVGTQIQLQKSNSSRLFFKLGSDLSGGDITISLDGGSEVNLKDIDDVNVTELSKGFIEVVDNATFFTYAPKGAKLDSIVTAIEDKGGTITEPKKVDDVATAIDNVSSWDDDLIAENIVNGKNIFGVVGNAGTIKSIQRGSVYLSRAITHITLDSINLDNSIILLSCDGVGGGETISPAYTYTMGHFTNSTTLTLETARASSSSRAFIGWQVIEFEPTAIKSMQSGVTAGVRMSPTTYYMNLSVTSVDLTKSLLILSAKTTLTSSSSGQYFYYMDDSHTIRFYTKSDASAVDTYTFSWFLIEFN